MEEKKEGVKEGIGEVVGVEGKDKEVKGEVEGE